ncbi:MAG TPA: glycosyltransferase family 39 protein, partial [Myxococcota bacterium]|nr:glycosyltransferase family 39 protein [Myxococcota bacterium]
AAGHSGLFSKANAQGYGFALLTLGGIALRYLAAPATPEMRWRLGFAYDPRWSWELWWNGWPAMGVEDIQKYGLGWPMLARVAVLLLGRSEAIPFLINPVIGGLCVALMVGLVRAVGGSPTAALWAGFSVAVTPLMVWYAHTDGPFAADALFTLLSLWATARYLGTWDRRYLVIGVCAVVSAAQMRVESASTGVAAALLGVAMWERLPWRRPEAYAAVAAATLLLAPHAILISDQLQRELQARYAEGNTHDEPLTIYSFLFTNPTMQSSALILALPLGALLGPLSWRLRAWALALMMASALTIPDVVPTETAFSVARYQMRAMPFAALLAGLGAAWLHALPPRRLLGGAFAVAALVGLRLAGTVSVMKSEYDFFAAHLGDVPQPCVIMTWRSQGDTALYVPLHLSRLRGLDHRWLDVVRDEVPAQGCVWYYRSSGCAQHYRASGEGERHAACADFEARWAPRPVAELAMSPDPVGPMGLANRLPGVPIPVGFFEVRAGP